MQNKRRILNTPPSPTVRPTLLPNKFIRPLWQSWDRSRIMRSLFDRKNVIRTKMNLLRETSYDAIYEVFQQVWRISSRMIPVIYMYIIRNLNFTWDTKPARIHEAVKYPNGTMQWVLDPVSSHLLAYSYTLTTSWNLLIQKDGGNKYIHVPLSILSPFVEGIKVFAIWAGKAFLDGTFLIEPIVLCSSVTGSGDGAVGKSVRLICGSSDRVRIPAATDPSRKNKSCTDSSTAKRLATCVSVTGPRNWTLQTDAPCHSRCGTLKNPDSACSMAMSVEHILGQNLQRVEWHSKETKEKLCHWPSVYIYGRLSWGSF